MINRKNKFYYNKENCRYEPVKLKNRHRIFNFFGFILLVLAFAIVTNLVATKYFPSPALSQAQNEIEVLRQHYTTLKQKQGEVNNMLSKLAERDNSIYRVIFEADPIPFNVRNANIGGANRYQELESSLSDNKDLIVDMYKGIDELRRKMFIQTESYDAVVSLINNKEDMLASMPYIPPVENPTKRLASGYGIRMHPIYKIRKMHTGIDFSAKRGTPIYATGKGKVIRARYSRGYGRQIVIDHGYGYKTRYAHMQKYAVAKGQKVKRGDLIGYVGSTGGSTGPHLHYEVLKNNKAVNPVYYFSTNLSNDEYSAVLEKASVENQSLDNF